MTLQRALIPRIADTAFHGQGQEAAESGENQHTFLQLHVCHLSGNEVEREMSC
jgi:hypothetical protein